jgi:hypothetical protein
LGRTSRKKAGCSSKRLSTGFSSARMLWLRQVVSLIVANSGEQFCSDTPSECVLVYMERVFTSFICRYPVVRAPIGVLTMNVCDSIRDGFS